MKVKSLAEGLAALFDPRGAAADVLTTDSYFKARSGLPVSAPHVQRDAGFQQAPAAALAPARFVAAAEANPPASRVRLVSRYVEEHWTPVYATTTSKNYAEILASATTVVGWNVEQKARSPVCDCLQARLELAHNGQLVHRQCGRARSRVDADESIEQHVLSLSIAPSDGFYDGFYPTIPGNDSESTSAGDAKGGTRIRHGRREYREKTKGFIHWDKGFVKERERAYATSQQAWIDDVRPRMEKANKQLLPRKIGEL